MFFQEYGDLQLLARRLGPRVREQPVAEDLRGWRWYRPPLSPIFDAPLTAHELADTECGSGRDLYLTRVLDERPRRTGAQVEEAALRRVVARAVLEAKQALYAHGKAAVEAIAALPAPALGYVLEAEGPGPAGLAERVAALWGWECGRLAARVSEAIAAQPRANVDALCALALPVVVGQQVDGRFLGLAEGLEIEGLAGPALVVTSLRFGPVRRWDRLLTTGLALALEAVHETAVDLGCVVYGGFVDGRPAVQRDLHVIDDELRQQFIELRDERARLVQEEIDPGLPERCSERCGFLAECRGGGGGGPASQPWSVGGNWG